MTHDELLARIAHDFNSKIKILDALHSVVELHTADFGTPREDVVCDYCKSIYPCLTIQAIEKELN